MKHIEKHIALDLISTPQASKRFYNPCLRGGIHEESVVCGCQPHGSVATPTSQRTSVYTHAQNTFRAILMMVEPIQLHTLGEG